MKTYLFFALTLISFFLHAQNPVELKVDAGKVISPIQPTMWGIFFEDINFAADGGLYPEMIKNSSFEFDERLMGWLQPNSSRFSLNETSGMATVFKEEKTNQHYLRIDIKNFTGYELINEGFRGMGVKEGAEYSFSMRARNVAGAISQMNLKLVDDSGNVLSEASLNLASSEWKNYGASLKANTTEAHAKLKITFSGNGIIDLDILSLFPKDTWMGRPHGLRKDLVQLLADLKPGFIRFPGGCIVEGRTLEQRYQWKKTIGNMEDREWLINRWNTEFKHRPTPDYFQSFGLGFYEYFQLAEDIGAEPLPILGCGMACQFNTAELAPVDEMDEYLQDAMDLIEFANGSVDSKWGSIRASMGHPKPFNMKFIGIGNEQWGEEYFTRLELFMKAIQMKYPEITIVTSAGPFAEGEHFDLANKELKRLNAKLVDEHYYKNPEWFLKNADRYDSYDRNSYKIFAGEYAAQSVSTGSPDNKNNWQCALAEAAFLTGIERNADVVHLSSYAPLFAHTEAWQWTPDLIWFDNLSSYGTPNYYVQKMFSNNKGTTLISVTSQGKIAKGQNDLYVSAVKDDKSKEVIVKIVNSGQTEQTVKVLVDGVRLGTSGTLIQLASNNLEEVNSIEQPNRLAPTETSIKTKGKNVETKVPPYSFSVIKLKVL